MGIKKIKPTVIFKSDSPKDTISVAKLLAKKLKGGEIIFLKGPIGSGKTVFVKGLALCLKTKANPVSASFTLIRTYKGRKSSLTHIDAFRLKKCEGYNLGLEEIFSAPGTIIAVEWPDEISAFFPEERLEIEIKLLSGDKRKIKFTAIGKNYLRLLSIKIK